MQRTGKAKASPQTSKTGKIKKAGNRGIGRPTNAAVRTREHLTEKEVNALIKAAKKTGRHQHRDATLITLMYHHGLRVSEAISLCWDQINFERGLIYVTRLKNGTPSSHFMINTSDRGNEMRSLRRLKREQQTSPYVFTTERGGPMTASTVRKMITRAGKIADLPFPIHPHMLRHACGYRLANDGHDTRSLQHYLGHRNIQHTVHYTEMSPDRFKGFWND
ncbi:tyrosine-type recombinase/integrase [Sedimenticola selenatireducens]|uniref:tyrosine-type recombinase/integrase n=1 Tax=Sedimenticola selenatireducens TaxID=191960 RepID=UPI002AAA62A4|nr:tyrosine-type recombinase/integrase [Sedimenticola selenatireducens]